MSSMLSPWQAGIALGAAMLALTACDPRSPTVPTPKAVQSVALDVAAPAPALTLNFPERTRLPSTAKAGEPGLDSLASEGSHSEVDFILLCLLKQSLREFRFSRWFKVVVIHTLLPQAFMSSFQSYCGEMVDLLVSDPVGLFSFTSFFVPLFFLQSFRSFTSCSSIFS